MDKKDLNNKVILLRKSLKSIFNQTKLNLSRKIKSLKKNDKQKQSALRKESEFEALKRIKPTDVPLYDAVYPEKLHKTLTNPSSSEVDRAISRVLLNPLVQKTIQQLKDKHGATTVEIFLKDNEKNIKKNIKQKLENPKKAKVKKVKSKVPEKIASDESEAEGESEVEESEKEEVESKSDEAEIEESKKVAALEDLDKDDSEVEVKATTVEKVSIPKPRRKRNREEIVKKSSDSFFVDSSGQNYLATVANGASRSASEDEDERPPFKKQPQKGKTFTQKFKPIKSKRFDETPPAFVKRNQAMKKPEFKGKQLLVKKFEMPVKKPDVKAPPAKPSDGDIHPSWKAKAQMRKTQIQDFQGTKIKFDD